MGLEQEAVVRAFMAEMECEQQDAAQVERVVSHMAPDARFHVYAWEDPLVGLDAIRAELLRQASVFRNLRIDIVTIASAGQLVFTERLDSMILRGEPLTAHIAGVFEVNTDGKIAIWRDYFDSREVAAQVGADSVTAGERSSAP
jgi:limonene-1,2-epoxide hydrolase